MNVTTTQMLSSKSTSYNCNFVHQDTIWKDHVKLELKSQKQWVEDWGFLKAQKEEEEIRDTSIEDTNIDRKYPQTTTAKMGYKMQELPTYKLEMKSAKVPKGGLDKLLGWPADAI